VSWLKLIHGREEERSEWAAQREEPAGAGAEGRWLGTAPRRPQQEPTAVAVAAGNTATVTWPQPSTERLQPGSGQARTLFLCSALLLPSHGLSTSGGVIKNKNSTNKVQS